jgi:Outer membrane efflux protein/Phage integrase family
VLPLHKGLYGSRSTKPFSSRCSTTTISWQRRTTIQQSQAAETTAKLRPNPTLFSDWEYLPLFSPSSFNRQYLHDSTEADVGLGYLIERGRKRQHRFQAAKDITAQTRSLVADNERSLTFSVASLFVNVQLAESTLELAEQDLKSFQQTVNLGEIRYEAGAISEDDYLKIKLQMLQFETDLQQAQLARVQALSDLRQLLGYESVSADYDVTGHFDYQPLKGNLDDFQMKALQNRPDLRAAQQGVTAANSQYELQRAIGKPDSTVQANYSHVNGINTATFYWSMPLPIFSRNQGEIARARFAINPCSGVEFPVAVKALFRPHYVTWSEQRTIEAHAPEYLRNIVRIITETGLRVYKELMPMKKEQLDLANAMVWGPDSKTPNGVAEVPLTPLALEAFRDQMRFSPCSPYLFPSDENPSGHQRTLKSAWHASLRRAKVPYFRIYDLRSTSATRLSAGGGADEWVTQMLRQGDAQVFKKYSQMKL